MLPKIMLFYTKKQYESAIQENDKRIDDILDSFRDTIIEQLEAIAKSDGYKEKYELLLRNKGYYENIKQDMQTGKDYDEIFKKYDLCFRGPGYGDSTCWYLLDKIEYDNNMLRFYIDGYWSLPPDYGKCNCRDIPSRVLWSALKEFKKHITCPIKENTTEDKTCESQEEITIDVIMSFLSENGFAPQRENDTYIAFKYQEEFFEIHYDSNMLELLKRAKIKNEHIPAAEKAFYKTMRESWLLKIFFLDDGDNAFFFSVQNYVESVDEMKKSFKILLGQLIGGINLFSENFHQIWLDMQRNQ